MTQEPHHGEMAATSGPEREGHTNQFGVVRLGLAVMVIFSHAFPLAGGRGTSDPLYALTGTTTFGDLAVDFFFVISGYLVTQSLQRSRTIKAYFTKRIRRIYPGFLVAIPLSLGVGLSCSGSVEWPVDAVRLALSVLTLQQPYVTAAFGGNPYPIANGSLWTIRYEALCYLLPVLALFGRLRWPALTFILAIMLLLLSGLYPRGTDGWLSTLHNGLRLTGSFLVGMGLMEPFLRSRPRTSHAVVAALLCAASLFWSSVAGLGIGLSGGYAVLALCLHPGRTPMSGIGRRTDVSYGTYLYGWPIENLIVWLLPTASSWLTVAFATPLALVAGWLSWRYIEAPFLKRRLRATLT